MGPSNGNGNGFPPETPWWARLAISYGILGVLVMYLLGMFDGIPGVKSPITRLTDGLKDATTSQTEVIRALKEAVDRDRIESSEDRRVMIKELSGLRDDLYATRSPSKR